MKRSLLLTAAVLLSLLALTGCQTQTTDSPLPADTTAPVDYGKLQIPSVNVYGTYYVKLQPLFTDPAYEREITYEYDTSLIRIEDGKVYPLVDAAKVVPVTARTEYHEAKFKVFIKSSDLVDSAHDGFKRSFNAFVANYEAALFDRDSMTFFIGDSFFDTRFFFTDFYTTRFPDDNAFCFGIGSTQSRHWIWYSQELYAYKPQNVVFHIGTNDVFNRDVTTENSIIYLKQLLNNWHENVPSAKLYWFTVEPRLGQSSQNEQDVATLNDAIFQMAAESGGWLTVINTNPAFAADTTLYAYGDAVHPSTAGYDVMMNLAYETGLVISKRSAARDGVTLSGMPLSDDGGLPLIGLNYTDGGIRDYLFAFDGQNYISGDFALSVDFTRTGTTEGSNGYLGISFSDISHFKAWEDYHLFYQQGRSGHFLIHSSYGSKATPPVVSDGAPDESAIPSSASHFTLHFARSDKTVYLVYELKKDGESCFYVSENQKNRIRDMALWINMEYMTGTFSSPVLTTDPAEVSRICERFSAIS